MRLASMGPRLLERCFSLPHHKALSCIGSGEVVCWRIRDVMFQIRPHMEGGEKHHLADLDPAGHLTWQPIALQGIASPHNNGSGTA